MPKKFFELYENEFLYCVKCYLLEIGNSLRTSNLGEFVKLSNRDESEVRIPNLIGPNYIIGWVDSFGGWRPWKDEKECSGIVKETIEHLTQYRKSSREKEPNVWIHISV